MTGNWGLGRHDSGIDLADASELQKWKRAYHVQQESHDMALQCLANRHKTDLDLLKAEHTKHLRTMSSMMRTSAESNRAVADARIKELEKVQDEKMAGLREEHESKIADKEQQVNNIVSMFQGLDAKYEELKKKSSQERLEEENKALKIDLQNTRHVNSVQAREFAELQTAWQQEIAKNRDRVKVDQKLWTAETRVAHFKTMWEKECAKNMALRCEQEAQPGTRVADMEQYIEFLKKELNDSYSENNKNVAAFNEREEEHTKLKYVHAAEVAAVCGQVKLYKSKLRTSREHTRALWNEKATLIMDLSNTLNSDDVSKALHRYCDIVSHDDKLESSLGENAELLEGAYSKISSLEIKNSALQLEITKWKLELDSMELQRNQYMDKVNDLEFRAYNTAEFHEKDMEAKDAQIRDCRSQMSIFEIKLRSSVNAFSRYLLESKDNALDKAHQRIQNLEHDLHIRGYFHRLDEGEKDHWLSDLEPLPARLHAAEIEIKRLREQLGLEGESSTHDGTRTGTARVRR